MNKFSVFLGQAFRYIRSHSVIFTINAFLVVCIALVAYSLWQTIPVANETTVTPMNPDTDWWSGVQKHISQAEYEIVRQEQTPLSVSEPAYEAPNRAHNFRSHFTSDGVKLQPRIGQEERWQWTLQLSEFGYAEAMQPVADAELIPNGNRITYQHDGISEWYINDENGLEQGFTIQKSPGLSIVGEDNKGSGELILVLNVGSTLSPKLIDNGTAVDFFREDKSRVLRYGKLVAFDANQETLPAQMQLSGCAENQNHTSCQIQLIIDDKEALYPITVDPIATSPDWQVESNSSNAYLGYVVDTAGDVNGDGYADIIIGAPYFDVGTGNEGRVFVFHGSATGLITTTTIIDADWSFNGTDGGANLGAAARTAGDVNNDGYDDVVVGAPYWDSHLFGGSASDLGKAYVFLGSSAGLTSTAESIIASPQADIDFGESVSKAGDVNGDGYDDIIIGAPSDDSAATNAGQVYAYHGSSSGIDETQPDWSYNYPLQQTFLGRSVDAAGDVNGDGYDDIIVGSSRTEGAAVVINGSATGLLAFPSWMSEGDPVLDEYFGYAVSTAGDVNNDGFDDILIGAPYFANGQTNEGAAFIYLGSSNGLSMTSDWQYENDVAEAVLGASVAGVGDVNGDNYDDILIGAPYYSNGQTTEGAAYLFYGTGSGPDGSPDWSIEGNLANAALGFSVGPAGDINGNNLADFLIGLANYSNGQISEGSAYFFYGVDDNHQPTATPTHTPTATPMGQSCITYESEDVSQTIPANGTQLITSTLVVPDNVSITDVNVPSLIIEHEAVSDLEVYLQSPDDTSVQLMASSCPGYHMFNVNIKFDDEAAPGAWPCPPINAGTYQPESALSAFDNENSDGTWTLYISDIANGNGGLLHNWGLEICTNNGTPVSPTVTATATATDMPTVTPTNTPTATPTSTATATSTGTPLAAGFSALPLSGTMPLTVTFTNESSNATSYEWQFGDGTTSTEPNPTHTYTQAGSYTVTLIAYGPGGQDTEVKQDYITVSEPESVQAFFSAVPLNGPAPLTVSFTDESTGNISSYDWDFGDGGIATQENPTHIYTESGVYTVTLTTTDANNVDDTIVRPSYIFVDPDPVILPNQAPVITITNPIEGAVFSNGNIQVSGELNDDGQIASVLVNDIPATVNGNAFSANLTLNGGNQTIKAVAEDDEGAMGFDSIVVSIDDEGPIINVQEPLNRQSVYTLNPTVIIDYADFLDTVNTNSVVVQITDENNVTTNVTNDLNVTSEGVSGSLSTALTSNMSYTMTVSAADSFGNVGNASSSFYVPEDPGSIILPTEPEDAGWVSGVVYDSSTCNEYLTTCQGIPGVHVTFSKAGDRTDVITGTIVTGPDGFFAFPFVETGVYWLRAEKDNFTYGQREVAAVKERSTAVNEIYLTPIDNKYSSCTASGCTHENIDEEYGFDGGMIVDIPPGAIGVGETVDVTATAFDRVYFLPSGQLPPGTWETYAFNLGGDSDYFFQKPITVSIRNSRDFAPGTKIPLGYWNQDTLQWEHEGVAEVDSTGDYVVMNISHFSNHDPNFPVNIVESGITINPYPQTGGGYCSAGSSGCFIDYKSGRLQEWVDLPETNVMGDSVAPQLLYNTARAEPSFVIDVQLDAEVQGNVETNQIQWQLYIEGERTDNFTFTAVITDGGEIGRFRFFWDGRNAQGDELPPGIYNYAMRVRIPYETQYCVSVGNIFGNPPDCENRPTNRYTTVTEEQWVFGTIPLDGTPDPALGDGWAIAGQQRLYADEAGNILVTDARNQAEYYSVLADKLEGRGQYNNVQPQVLGPSAAVPVPDLPPSGTFVNGVINANTTWTLAQSPYIITNTVIVTDGVNLTIEPGTQVMLEQYQSLVVEGSVQAVGTEIKPITFTAYSDTSFLSWERYNTLSAPTESVTVADNGDVWFAGALAASGGSQGVAQLLSVDSIGWETPFYMDVFEISPTQVYGIAIDSLGQAWFATNDGVAMLDSDREWAYYQYTGATTPELLSNDVRSVAVDAGDNIWFGTDQGVSQLTSSGWVSYTTSSTGGGLGPGVVRAIAIDASGGVWFGTDNGLSYRDAGGTWAIPKNTSNSDILGNEIADLAIDVDGNIWVTNPGFGVSTLLTNGDWNTYTPDRSGLVSPAVWSIGIDRSNRKWIGYELEGVSILSADNTEWEHETTPQLSDYQVSDIAAAPNGDVWLTHYWGNEVTKGYGGSNITSDQTIRSGYWDTIQIGGGTNLNDSDSSQLSYVNIEAGGASAQGSLYIYQSAPTLTNLRVWGSGNHGIEVADSSGFSLSDSTVTANRQDGIHLQSSSGGHTLNNVILQANNGHGVYLDHPGAVSITGATIADNRGHGIFTANVGNELDLDNSTIQNNKVASRLAVNTTLTNNQWLDNKSQQIELLGGTLSNNKVWKNEVEAYVVLDTIHVPDNMALTIDPGLSLLFANSGAYLDVFGALFASGTLDMPIYFGPTANLGSRWSGIYLGGGITGDSDVSHLEYAIFQDAFTGLYINNSAPTLNHLSFLDNDIGLEVVNSNGLVISNSNFTNNTSFGLENFTPSQPVTAVNNYWGAGGPRKDNDPLYPGNSGDAISAGVDTSPWRTTPVTMEGVGSQVVGQTGPDHTTLAYDETSDTYTRYYPDGGQIHFDTQGRHDYTLYADGRRFTYTYNPDGTTAAMALTAPGETVPHWVWDFTYANGQLDSITDPADRVTSFGLNAQGQMNQVAYPDGSHEAFFYDSQGQMTQHTDKNGAVTDFDFDAYGRIDSETQPLRAVFEPATGQTSASSPVHDFTPSDTAYPPLNESAVGDPANPIADTVFKSDQLRDGVAFGQGGLNGLTNRWGQWQEVTDATGRKTSYDRDDGNNLLKQTYNNGDCEIFTYDAVGNPLTASRLSAADCAQPTPANPQTVSMSYEARFNQIKTVTDPDDNTTTYFYDYEVDANDGNLNDDAQLVRVEYTEVADETGQLVVPTEYYSYNQWGLLETKTDADGKVTRYIYTQDSDTGLFLPGVTPKPGLLTQVISGYGTAIPLTTTYQDFNAQGYALTLIAPGGENITHYTYDEWGRVISETNAANATTLYTYNEQGNLVQSIEDYTVDGVTGANIVTDYRYDDSQQLVAEERGAAGLAAHTRYGYDINGNSSQQLDELNLGSVTLYDDANRPTQSINAMGEVITTTYDLKGRVETTISPDGVVDRTEYDDFGRVERRISNWVDGVYDANVPDEDLITSYQYDDRNNTIIVTDTVGRMNRTFYDNLNRTIGSISNWQDDISLDDCFSGSLPVNRDYNICSRTAYDEVGRSHINTDTLGRMSRTFYDELGRVKANVNNWNPATLTTPADCILSPTNESEENICTLYGYDSAGRQKTTTNALNQTSLTVYDAADRQVVSVSNWDGITAFTEAADCVAPPLLVADVNVCSVSVYDNLGRQTRSIDALGHFTDYEYDGLGRVVTTTRYLANGTPVSSVSHYDERGQQYAHTDAEGHTSKSVFDDLGRVTTSITPMGIASTQTYDDAGQVVASTNALRYTNTSLYDDLGRLLVSTNPLTYTTSYQYDSLGNQETVTDAESVVTRHEYDGLNRQTAVIENWDGVASCQPGTSSPDTNVCTQYTYDVLGNKVTTVNALGITAKTTTYDTLNRVIVEEDALGNQTRTQYNALGYRTVMTDANEAITRYTYDGLNRLKEVVYEADGETVTYAYDALGKRTAMTDSLGVTSYEYDTLSRLITATSPLTGTVIYGYDLVGNQTNLTYPPSTGSGQAGKVITTTYNADGQEVTVTDWEGGVTRYTYDTAGRLATTTLPNGVQTTNDYDPANQLTGISHVDLNSGALQAAYLYELDKRGHNTVVTETMRLPDGSGLNHQVIAYDYDPLYRITEAAYTGVLSGTYAYDYNAVGSRVYYSTNITNTETTTYTYNIANQLQESKDLLTAELTTYDWDDAGRLITTTVASAVDKVYQYSQDGDLTQAEVAGLVTTFAYDGNGSRLQMSVAGETTTYLPDYGGRSSRVLFEQGTEEAKHYLYGVACLGEFVTDNTTSDTEWRYYQRDAKSLVRQTTNEAATITLAWTFSPEGGVLLGEEGPVTHLGCGDDAVYDWSTGLIFKSGRYFDPNNGIWITMSGAVIWQKTQTSSRRKRRMSKKLRYLMMIFLLLVLVLALTGCGDPSPDVPECPTPPPTPIPSETPPPPVGDDPTEMPEDPTETPEDPTETPELPNPTPTEPPPTNTPPPTVNPLGTPFRDPEPPYEPVLPSRIKSFDQHLHDDGPGIDMVPETRRGGGDAARDFYVISLRDGKATNNQNENHGIDYGIGPNMIAISPLGSNEYEIMYSHVVPVRSLNGALGVPVTAGTVIGTIMDVTQDNYAAVYSDDDHLHLGYREPVSGNYKDPADYDLISAWGPEGFDR